MAEEKDKFEAKEEKSTKQSRPTLTPEQEAEAAAKKTARAAGKSGKGKEGKSASHKGEIAVEKVKRTAPARLRLRYQKEIQQILLKELSLSNVMEVPQLTKISINLGLGEAITNPKVLEVGVEDLTAISGQKPVVTKSGKAIAAFKLKAGQKIGAMVTLRRDCMYEFLDRLITFALPRVRDFKGISPKGFDGRGNYTLGVKEGNIFPEIAADRLEKPKGMNITICTTAKTDEHGRALLRHLGMPFRS